MVSSSLPRVVDEQSRDGCFGLFTGVLGADMEECDGDIRGEDRGAMYEVIVTRPSFLANGS